MNGSESKMNSASGMMLMKAAELKPLDITQVLSIIEACAAHGVTIIKFGDLHIEFSTPPSKVPQKTPDNPISDAQHTENMKDAIEQAEMLIRADQVAELLVTDPRAAEQLLEDGELDDADDEPGDE